MSSAPASVGFLGGRSFALGSPSISTAKETLTECGMGPGPETAVAVLRCIGLVEAYAPPLGRMYSAFFPVLLRASAPGCRSWHLREFGPSALVRGTWRSGAPSVHMEFVCLYEVRFPADFPWACAHSLALPAAGCTSASFCSPALQCKSLACLQFCSRVSRLRAQASSQQASRDAML